MNRNKFGRDRVLLTKENVTGIDAGKAGALLSDIDQYAFDSLDTMRTCAESADSTLLSFTEVTGRLPHHGYENEEFLQNQLDGTSPRYYCSNDSINNETLNIDLEVAAWERQLLDSGDNIVQFNDVEPQDDIAKAVSGQHYNDVVPGFQYMEMMQHMLEGKEGVESHLLGQVYKYLMRAGKKDDVEQEYRKARWYLNALVKFKQTGEVDCSGND